MAIDTIDLYQDTWLDSYPGFEDDVNGSDTNLEMYCYNGVLTYPLLKVADSNISKYTNKIINSVKLKVYIESLSNLDQWTNGIHMSNVTSSWDESTASWNNKPTWSSTIIDHDVPQYTGWYQFDITDIFNLWLISNNGLIMYGEAGYTPASVSSLIFTSMNGTNTPYLIVDYENGTIGCTIDSEEVSILQSWSVQQNINMRSSMNCTVTHLGNLTSIDNGDSIEFVDQYDNTVFAGLVKSIKKYDPFNNSGQLLYYDLTCVDYSSLADKRKIAESIESELAEDIVIDYILPILSEEGVSQGTIDCSLSIEKAIFNYITIAEALNQLASLTSGYIWYIDENKKLHFFHKSSNVSDLIFDENIAYYDIEENQDMDNYRNKQYIRGGKAQTDTQTKESVSPTPDGSIRKYNVRFPIATKPIIYVNDVAVSSDYVGINGVDTGKYFYFNYDSKDIIHDDGETPLDAGLGDTLTVTYKGYRELFLVSDSAEQIADRASKESGTSGIYENIYKETAIDDAIQALEYADALIVKYGEIKNTVNFKTEQVGLKAGQMLKIENTLFELDDYYLIESISISQLDPLHFEYSVKCLDGAAVGGWEQFFVELIKSNRDFTINDSEVLIIILNQQDSTRLNSSMRVRTFTNILYFSPTLYMSPTQTMNNTWSSEVTLY